MPVLCSCLPFCLNFAFYNFCSQSKRNILWCSIGRFYTFGNSTSHYATLQAKVFNIQCCRLSISPSSGFGVCYYCVYHYSRTGSSQIAQVFISLAFIVAALPLFYISVVTLHWMCSQRPFGQRMLGRVHGWIAENNGQMVAAGSEESLPNRLINPEEYDEDLQYPVAIQVENNMSSHSNSNTNN